MADVNRWSVTYTKHLKQKRKVYHDGFLILHSMARKAMLYDESETLLECRILKAEEVVRSGETLTFNAYLIDVGDPEGELKAPKDSGIGSKHRNEFMSPSVSAGQPSKTEKNRAQKINLSPSHKIIREFKKRELHTYGSLQKSTNSVEPGGSEFKKRELHKYGSLQKSTNSVEPGGSVLEWHALYTTQLTQKAKKYQDGFLRCPNNGSMGRQVMLYDESWKILESRFLKKGEELESGETIEFQGHLVEIGERKERNKTVPDMNAKGRSCSSFQKLEHPKQEWQVLYTTQVAQKAKKYHDGFLQLVTCGSLGRQVMLCDASRKLLDSRFLKKDEIIKSGVSMAFDGHLVEIGELEGQQAAPANLKDGGTCGGAGELKIGLGNCNKDEESIMRDRACSVKSAHTDSGSYLSERQKSSQGVSREKPIRDASGILSIIQKPACKENVAECANKSVLVKLDAPPKGIEDSDACTFNSRDDDELWAASATEAGSVKQPIENQGTKRATSRMDTRAGTESNEKDFVGGSAVDERKISEVETASASKVDDAWPSFNLGF